MIYLKSKENLGSAAGWPVICPNSMQFDQLVSEKLGLTAAPRPGKFVKSTQPCIARFRWDLLCGCICLFMFFVFFFSCCSITWWWIKLLITGVESLWLMARTTGGTGVLKWQCIANCHLSRCHYCCCCCCCCCYLIAYMLLAIVNQANDCMQSTSCKSNNSVASDSAAVYCVPCKRLQTSNQESRARSTSRPANTSRKWFSLLRRQFRGVYNSAPANFDDTWPLAR